MEFGRKPFQVLVAVVVCVNTARVRACVSIVIVMCASPDSVREIMIMAHRLNFDNGEYVFINIDLFGRSLTFSILINQFIRQSMHIYEHNICQWQVARKTQSSTSWRPIFNGTKANVVLEKNTIQYNIQKNIQAKRKQEAKYAKKN